MSKNGVFSGLYFPAIGLNTERYEVFSANAGKYRPVKTLYLQTFHAVFCIIIYSFACQFSLPSWNYNATTIDTAIIRSGRLMMCLQNRCSYEFDKIHKKTPTLGSRFKRSCRSIEFNFIKKRDSGTCLLVILGNF